MLPSLIGVIASSGGAAGGATSYESIATVSGNGSASTLTFSSIPSTYQHLQIRWIARDGRATTSLSMKMQVNSDTGANYTSHRLYGLGSAAYSDATTSTNQFYIDRIGGSSAPSNTFGAGVIDLLDYANNNKYKTVRSLGGYEDNTVGSIWLDSGVWMSTSAISSISLVSNYGDAFASNTSFALYGIKG